MDLFGRKQRKERIEELEDKVAAKEATIDELRDRLEQRKTKESQRAKEAEAAKQEAERKLNRYRDKVRTLKDRLDEDTDEDTVQQELWTYRLPTVADLLQNLDRLEFKHSDALTVYQQDSDLVDSSTGSVAFVNRPLLARVLIPPLPVTGETYQASTFNTDQLQDQIQQRYCLIHLSAGGSGAALIDDREIEQTELVDADIKAEHKKGGYSQKRFERLREEQLESHVETVIEQIDNLVQHGYDHLLLTGNVEMRAMFRERADHDATTRETEQRAIQESGDLMDVFNAALSCKIRPLRQHEIESLEDSHT